MRFYIAPILIKAKIVSRVFILIKKLNKISLTKQLKKLSKRGPTKQLKKPPNKAASMIFNLFYHSPTLKPASDNTLVIFVSSSTSTLKITLSSPITLALVTTILKILMF